MRSHRCRTDLGVPADDLPETPPHLGACISRPSWSIDLPVGLRRAKGRTSRPVDPPPRRARTNRATALDLEREGPVDPESVSRARSTDALDESTRVRVHLREATAPSAETPVPSLEASLGYQLRSQAPSLRRRKAPSAGSLAGRNRGAGSITRNYRCREICSSTDLPAYRQPASPSPHGQSGASPSLDCRRSAKAS